MRTTMSRIPRRLVSLSMSQISGILGIVGRARSLAVVVVGVALGATQAQAQPASEPAPANPPPPTVASANPLAKQQLEQIRTMIVAMPKMFEFHGYFRSGF